MTIPDVSSESSPDWSQNEEAPQVLGDFLVAAFATQAALATATTLGKKKQRIYTLGVPSPAGLETASAAPTEIQQEPAPRCTPEEKKIVVEIFTTLATASWTQLLWNKKYLTDLGKKIEHIHTFSLFLALPKESIQSIFHDGWGETKARVIGDMVKGLEKAKRANKADCYAHSLATEMGKDPQRVIPLIQACRWKELVRYLFDIRRDALRED